MTRAKMARLQQSHNHSLRNMETGGPCQRLMLYGSPLHGKMWEPLDLTIQIIWSKSLLVWSKDYLRRPDLGIEYALSYIMSL